MNEMTPLMRRATRPSPQTIETVTRALAAMFGNRLVTSQAVREQHGHTLTWTPNQPPDAVVFAQSTEDVSAIVKLCAGHGVPVIAYGTGTSLEGHVNAPYGGVCIDLSQMNALVEVHPEDLDCVVQPGITRKALNDQLRDTGLFFPIDPGADASIGGMAATRASGTNAVRYGTMKDNVLSLTVVHAEGRVIVKTARRAQASPRPATTSPGSSSAAEGTLGVVTEITLRLFGIPEAISGGDRARFRASRRRATPPSMTIQSGLPVARIELLDDLHREGRSTIYSKLGLAGNRRCCCVEFHGTPAERRGTGRALRRDRDWRIRRRPVPMGDASRKTARSSGRRGTMSYYAALQTLKARHRSGRVRDRHLRADFAACRLRHANSAGRGRQRHRVPDRRPRR